MTEPGAETVASTQAAGDWAHVLRTFQDLLDAVVSKLGPWPTVALFGLLIGAALFWRWRQERRVVDEVERNAKVYEATIQRLAAEAREYRFVFFTKHLKMTEDEAERMMLRNELLVDGPTTRKILEQQKAQQAARTKDKETKS